MLQSPSRGRPSMSVQRRHNVHVSGSGPQSMVFAHGFGCDQNMWRLLVPHVDDRWRIVLYDLVGSGASDLSAYDRGKYRSLHGHASDLLEVIETEAQGPVVFVGHSVSAMIGLLALRPPRGPSEVQRPRADRAMQRRPHRAAGGRSLHAFGDAAQRAAGHQQRGPLPAPERAVRQRGRDGIVPAQPGRLSRRPCPHRQRLGWTRSSSTRPAA